MSDTGEAISDPTAQAADASETAFLLKYLETHDAACPLCRYNLRGLTVARCPECGREIRLTVGMKEPYLRAMVTFLVAMCLSAGCGVFVWIMFLNEAIRYGFPDIFRAFQREPFALLLFCAVMFSVVPTALSIILHKKFLRLNAKVQYMLATFALIWDGMLLLLLFGLILRLIR